MSTPDLASVAARVLPLLDLTSLGEDDQPADIDRLCADAQSPAGPVAAVCVWPRFVAQAVDRLAGTGIPVAAVANFPEGDDDDDRARADASAIVEAGGTEVDVVVPWRLLVDGAADGSGSEEAITRLVAATKAEIGDGVALKAILETGELVGADPIGRAALAALDGGADFLKTSTGKTARSATPEAAQVLIGALTQHADRGRPDGGRPRGLKVSGGVGTVEQAAVYLAMAEECYGSVGPDQLRFGASRLLGALLEVLNPPRPD
ncbi:MAG: deoxyribose-phosphate aldolase [Actinomycetota bacterium]